MIILMILTTILIVTPILMNMILILILIRMPREMPDMIDLDGRASAGAFLLPDLTA